DHRLVGEHDVLVGGLDLDRDVPAGEHGARRYGGADAVDHAPRVVAGERAGAGRAVARGDEGRSHGQDVTHRHVQGVVGALVPDREGVGDRAAGGGGAGGGLVDQEVVEGAEAAVPHLGQGEGLVVELVPFGDRVQGVHDGLVDVVAGGVGGEGPERDLGPGGQGCIGRNLAPVAVHEVGDLRAQERVVAGGLDVVEAGGQEVTDGDVDGGIAAVVAHPDLVGDDRVAGRVVGVGARLDLADRELVEGPLPAAAVHDRGVLEGDVVVLVRLGDLVQGVHPDLVVHGAHDGLGEDADLDGGLVVARGGRAEVELAGRPLERAADAIDDARGMGAGEPGVAGGGAEDG